LGSFSATAGMAVGVWAYDFRSAKAGYSNALGNVFCFFGIGGGASASLLGKAKEIKTLVEAIKQLVQQVKVKPDNFGGMQYTPMQCDMDFSADDLDWAPGRVSTWSGATGPGSLGGTYITAMVKDWTTPLTGGASPFAKSYFHAQGSLVSLSLAARGVPDKGAFLFPAQASAAILVGVWVRIAPS
jgi:hypothetical protein